MRRMREDRFILGSSADMPDVWSYALLRQLAKSTRYQTCACKWTSGNCLGSAGGTLALLLSGRSICRILSDGCVGLLSNHQSLRSSVASPLLKREVASTQTERFARPCNFHSRKIALTGISWVSIPNETTQRRTL